jgi:hypothetical protein
MKTVFTAKGATDTKEKQRRKTVETKQSNPLFRCFSFTPFASFAVNTSFVPSGE